MQRGWETLEHQGLIWGVQLGNREQQKPCSAKAFGIAGVQRAVNDVFGCRAVAFRPPLVPR